MDKDYKKGPNKNGKLFFNAPVLIIVISNSQVHGALVSSNNML